MLTHHASDAASNTSCKLEPPAPTWECRFAATAGRHRSVTVHAPHLRSDPERLVLGASIATFQLGETGSGEHLIAAAQSSDTAATYVRSLEYFIGEEQEHGRLLELVLRSIDVPLRSGHWSDSAFVVIRRLRSLRTEILTLLIAELIAHRYYSALRDGVRDADLVEVFHRIHTDEVGHLDFHAETLPALLAEWSTPTRWAMRIIWNSAVIGASVLVAFDHRGALRLVDVTAWQFVVDVWKLRVKYDRRLWNIRPEALKDIAVR